MTDLRVVSETLVQATANKEESRRIDLTQSDTMLLFLGAIQKGLLFFKPKHTEDQTLFIQHLRSSLSRTLNYFTPLAGRLGTVEHDDSTVSYFIDCNNAGAQFGHAVADGVTIADILDPVYVPSIVHSFFQLNGVLNYEGVSKPLLAVQVTELVDGIFIGCTMNHSVVDGSSFWHFFNSWSEIHRGSDHISELPVLERWSLLNPSGCPPIRLPISTIKNISASFILPPLQERVFHFTKAKIAGLKARANTEAGTEKISSLQSLLAHIWSSATRNRSIDLEKEVELMILVGLRTRLQIPLPEKYFGNAVVPTCAALKAREILEHGLGYVALEINKVVASYTEDKVNEILASLLENPKPVTMEGIVQDHGRWGISSSPRFNVYGTDFGWGKPIAVRSGPGNKYDGKITLYPGKEEGSVDVEVCVSLETLQAMGNDLEFMDAVTV